MHGCYGVDLMTMTDDDSALFGLEAKTAAPESVAFPIRPEQVAKIRRAFEDAGIASQHDRKALVGAAARRDVPSLRDLTAVEGRRVLSWIKDREATRPKEAGSSWDMREEDTWIDKL